MRKDSDTAGGAVTPAADGGAVSRAGKKLRTKQEREALVEAALRFRGDITTHVYTSVAGLMASGELQVASMPSPLQFWRYCRGRHPDCPGSGQAAPQSTATRAAETPPDAPTDTQPAAEDADMDIQSALAMLNQRLMEVGAALHRRGLLEVTRQNQLKRLIKAIKRVVAGEHLARDPKMLVRDIRKYLADCQLELEATASEPAAAVALAVGSPEAVRRERGVPGSDELSASGMAPVQPASAPVVASGEIALLNTGLSGDREGRDGTWMEDHVVDPARSLYADPRTGEAEGSGWGCRKALAELSSPAPGTNLGSRVESKTDAQARLRAALLAPILDGSYTPRQVARDIRNAYAGKGNAAMQALLLTFPPKVRQRFRHMHHRTIERWRAKVRAQEAQRGEPGPPVLHQILRHTSAAVRQPWRTTPEVVALVCELATGPATLDYNAVHLQEEVWDQLHVEVSVRSIQRILQNHLSDFERIRAYGGSTALDIAFRRKLCREAAYANRGWIIDHTAISQEILSLSAEAARCKSFDLQVWTRQPGGAGAEDEIVTSIYATAIRDAYSRRTLAFRCWNHHPGAVETLITLWDAIRRFGVPEILYNDNGADFWSDAVRATLEALMVYQLFTRPYSPEGRAKLERWFRTLKERYCRRLPGYRGVDHPAECHPSSLLTLQQVEHILFAAIQRDEAVTPHTTTRETPFARYEASIGVRRSMGSLSAIDPAAALRLLPARSVKTTVDGVKFMGRWYYTEQLARVAIGTQLEVRFDPSYGEIIYLGANGPKNTLIFLGPAEVHGEDNPPPSFVDQRRAEHAVFQEVERHVTKAQEKRQAALRHARARKTAEQLCASPAAHSAPALPAGTSAPAQPQLPPAGPPAAPAAALDASVEPEPALPERVPGARPAESQSRLARQTVKTFQGLKTW